MAQRKENRETLNKGDLRAKVESLQNKIDTAVVFVPRTKDMGSVYSNGVTVYIDKDYAIVSRMYVRTVYTRETATYNLLNTIYQLQIKKQSKEVMTEEEDNALSNGLIFIQSLVITDIFATDLEYAFNSINDYLVRMEQKLKEIDDANLPIDDPSILPEMAQEAQMIDSLKKE